VTNEERKATIAGLIEERRGCEARGLTDRVAQIDKRLRELGAEGQPPAKRASKRKAAE
jgi:hypothetical protein